MTMSSPVQALYVHVPLCRTLCGYCDFYSERFDAALVEPLLEALLHELTAAGRAHAVAVRTIFVGGGTPTMLPAEPLARLLHACAQLAGPTGLDEFTVEANPATVTAATASVFATTGVNRASLGAQSFAPAELAVLERTHAPGQVGETLARCRAAGIRRFNLDLIFGIPGQTRASWLASLTAAVALDVEHLSCYGLTYEPGTPLHARLEAGSVRRMEPDLEADLYEEAIAWLAAEGYAQYEVSNFARPGAECRHNLVYWHNEPYLGIGPSAAGFVDEVRYKNVADLAAYVQEIRAGRLPRCEEERLTPERRARETAMLALRLNAGLDRRGFAKRFGRDPVAFFSDAVDVHVADGLVEVTEAAVRLTRAGRLVADTVIADFL